jgi:hypothetical protein
MEHFVGYHNSDKERRFNDGLPVPDGEPRRWDTNHRFKEATIKGNRLWVIEGQGTPKRYSLVTTGVMMSITPVTRRGMRHVAYQVDANVQPTNVTNLPWCRRLQEQRAFSHGMKKITDRQVIAGLESLLRRPSSRSNHAPEPEANGVFEEGATTQVLLTRYERDPAARKQCVRHYGTSCTACGVSFGDRYGRDVAGLIHVHHLTPLASIGAQSSIDPVRDLRPVCPNCHAVIHAKRPARTIEEVRQMLRDRQAKGNEAPTGPALTMPPSILLRADEVIE